MALRKTKTIFSKVDLQTFSTHCVEMIVGSSKINEKTLNSIPELQDIVRKHGAEKCCRRVRYERLN